MAGNPVLFTLFDGHGRPLAVRVEACGSFLNLTPEGYGQCVSLDWYGGRLRVHVNADYDDEEPKTTDLEGAREPGP